MLSLLFLQLFRWRKLYVLVCCIQIDVGGDVLRSYFYQSGIIHRLYCSRIPEQNDVAESKHIIEIGLTLLAHSKLTSPFWTRAFAIRFIAHFGRAKLNFISKHCTFAVIALITITIF